MGFLLMLFKCSETGVALHIQRYLQLPLYTHIQYSKLMGVINFTWNHFLEFGVFPDGNKFVACTVALVSGLVCVLKNKPLSPIIILTCLLSI